MPDTSMCEEHDCSLKNLCYRYTAKPSEPSQSYMKPKQIGRDCTWFWNNKNRQNGDK